MIDEPILMANQQGALNQDTIGQQEFLRLRDEFGLKNAVETGTCLGYTTEFLAQNFEKVLTVEVVDKYYNIAKVNRLNNYDNINMFLGSSSDLLYDALNDYEVGDKTLIFLDAHWGNHCPLKEELTAIAQAGIKPVIAIHDFVVPNHPELGFDSINGQPFTYEWLKPEIDEIYGEDGYEHHYNSEAVGAKRGIIYITPKQG